MEIRRWHYYIFLICALVHCLLAKPFSLNDAIEAESQQKQASETTSPTKLEDLAAERFSLNLTHFSPKTLKYKEFKLADSVIPRGKKISSLKYKKTYQIKSPLKPKKIKLTQKPRHKRKNQSVKREISGNDELNQKYIPLLKSLTNLVDNLLHSENSDSVEANSRKRKGNQYYSEKRNDVCTCVSKSESSNAESTSQEKTTTASILTSEVSITEDLSTTTTQATPSTTDNTAVSDVSSIRPNKNVPVLLSRNTFSSRRDHNGFSKRSSTAYNRSIEGDITRDYGNSEHNTRCGENESDTESNEENSCGTPRDDASGVRFRTELRGTGGNSRDRNAEIATDETDSSSESKNKTVAVDEFRGNIVELQGENILKNRGDETKSTAFLPKFVRRLRGHEPKDKTNFNTEKPIHSKKSNEESNFSVAINNTSHQRISDRGSTITKENQSINPRNEGVTSEENLSKSTHTNKTITKTPVVMIIDGYSVTRHKNGQNKLSKKAIHIHS